MSSDSDSNIHIGWSLYYNLGKRWMNIQNKYQNIKQKIQTWLNNSYKNATLCEITGIDTNLTLITVRITNSEDTIQTNLKITSNIKCTDKYQIQGDYNYTKPVCEHHESSLRF